MVGAAGLEPATSIPQSGNRPRQHTIKKDVTETSESALAFCLARIRETRPELATVMAAWDDLPETVKRGILAMVKAMK